MFPQDTHLQVPLPAVAGGQGALSESKTGRQLGGGVRQAWEQTHLSASTASPVKWAPTQVWTDQQASEKNNSGWLLFIAYKATSLGGGPAPCTRLSLSGSRTHIPASQQQAPGFQAALGYSLTSVRPWEGAWPESVPSWEGWGQCWVVWAPGPHQQGFKSFLTLWPCRESTQHPSLSFPISLMAMVTVPTSQGSSSSAGVYKAPHSV